MAYVRNENLENITVKLLQNWGVPTGQAEVIADTIVYAHRHEKHTHGITRMSIYQRKIESGLMSKETVVSKITDLGSITVLDCNDGFGQVAAYEAMKNSIHKAGAMGMAATFVRNSNNFGVAGYFGEMATKEGMVGIVLTSSGPAVAPPGGTKSIFGTNPVCFAFPTEKGNIILDMAISEAARGKIRLAQKNGEKIPLGWAVDSQGNPTDDPEKALQGNMLAIGGIKGFGLAMVNDIMAGLLSGSAFGGDIKPLGYGGGPSRHGHVLIAIDISKLMDINEYYVKIDKLIKNVKSCGESGKIFMPGERSAEYAKKNETKVDLKINLIEEYNQLTAKFGIKEKLEVIK